MHLQGSTHSRSGEGVGSWGLAGAAFATGRKRAGSLPLGQMLPWQGRLDRQVFGRRQVLLNASRCDCHAAPEVQRACAQPAHCCTYGEAWGKSLGLKGNHACLQKPVGSRGELASRNHSKKVLCGVQNKCCCPTEGEHPCCPHGHA